MEVPVSDVVAAALIAASASLVGSVLTFVVGIRSLRRSVSTSSGVPVGRVLEQVERRLGRVEAALAEVREWLAFREGRDRPPIWTPSSSS